MVLGCTELELLRGPEDCAVPLLPTARLHIEAAVQAAPQSPGTASTGAALAASTDLLPVAWSEALRRQGHGWVFVEAEGAFVGGW